MEHTLPSILENLSIIIPIGPADRSWTNLIPDLTALPKQAEIILVGPSKTHQLLEQLNLRSKVRCNLRCLVNENGRAQQLNVGAHETQKDFLWFLHADSRLTGDALPSLERSLQRTPNAIHFFGLRFLPDGPRRMRVNEIGATFRARFLRLPFGDQGFFLSRSTFEHLGGFDETAPFGEDHLFIWQAKWKRVPLRYAGTFIYTSARKYREDGWIKTTARHMALTARQAYPALIKHLKFQMSKSDLK